MDSKLETVVKEIGNKDKPLSHRLIWVTDLLNGSDLENSDKETLLRNMSGGEVSQEVREHEAELKDMIENLKRSPMRPATFIELTELAGSKSPYALVVMDNGDFAYLVVHDQKALKGLRLGDRVAIDGKASILIDKSIEIARYGDHVRLERLLDEKYAEVTTHHDVRKSVLLTNQLYADIKSGKVGLGRSLVLGGGDQVALEAVPQSDGLEYYKFLYKGPVPDVVVERDIGAPHRVIQEVAEHIAEEMTRPELRRKYGLSPCITRLLCGVTGSGKSMAINAIHRVLYDMMSMVTGLKHEELPNRVFKFKTSQMLSMWLGESDKNIDRLFDEIEKMAKERYTTKKGKELQLPVLMVMEEAEGLGRTRGANHDAIYDRILSSLLQRLDPNYQGLAREHIIFLSSTNEPHLVDPAFLRRLGGRIEKFGRLDRKAFAAVLSKHVTRVPVQNGRGKARERLLDDLDQWFYGKDVEPAVIQLQPGNVDIKRRDFLTGAIIDRSVQQAATTAWKESLSGEEESGLSTEGLQEAFTAQIDSLIEQLTPENIVHYLDLPDNYSVGRIDRLTN
jgi:ATP-dependent 26S proteasome regulatory subunit